MVVSASPLAETTRSLPQSAEAKLFYELKIYRAFDCELERGWKRLESASPGYVFQTYDWNALWYECVGSGRMSLCIVAVVVDGAFVAVFPFGVRRTSGLRIIECLGGDQSDYKTPLFQKGWTPKDSWLELWKQVRSVLPSFDVLLLEKIPETIAGFRNPFLEMLRCRRTMSAYAATLTETWQSFAENIPKQLRSDSKRQRRRLDDLGSVRIEIAGTDDQCLTLTDTMLTNKGRRYVESGARNVLADPRVRDFYLRAWRANQTWSVHTSALFCGDLLLATHWGVVADFRFYYLMPVVCAPSWQRYSPGRLLMESLIQWSIDQKLNCFDFTVGGEAYKKTWCDQELAIFEYHERNSLAGAVYLLAYRGTSWLTQHPYLRPRLMSLVATLRAPKKGPGRADSKIVGQTENERRQHSGQRID